MHERARNGTHGHQQGEGAEQRHGVVDRRLRVDGHGHPEQDECGDARPHAHHLPAEARGGHRSRDHEPGQHRTLGAAAQRHPDTDHRQDEQLAARGHPLRSRAARQAPLERDEVDRRPARTTPASTSRPRARRAAVPPPSRSRRSCAPCARDRLPPPPEPCPAPSGRGTSLFPSCLSYSAFPHRA